ncbi:Transmembrane ascorbate-dependent reductase CYB561 [Balamuthia mandrillaris]
MGWRQWAGNILFVCWRGKDHIWLLFFLFCFIIFLSGICFIYLFYFENPLFALLFMMFTSLLFFFFPSIFARLANTTPPFFFAHSSPPNCEVKLDGDFFFKPFLFL